MGRFIDGTMLTPRQQVFVDGVIAGKSATQAYLDAFQCSEDSANASGSRLIANVSVSSEIARRRSRIQDRIEKNVIISREKVLQRLADIGLAQVSDKNGDEPKFSEQVKALDVASKISGFYTEDAPHPDRPLADMSREERQRRLAELRAKEAAGNAG